MVGLIVPGNLKFCPYVSYYISAFKKYNIEYEIISWNKKGFVEDVNYSFNYISADEQMVRKSIGYLKFINFTKKICKQRRYDKIIVFTIAPAILIFRMLLRKFKGRYFMDIRDDTILRNLFSDRISKLIANSKHIISSSPEFEKWIGRKTTICHNVDVELVSKVLDSCAYEFKKPEIPSKAQRIMFAGTLLEWEINFEFIKAFQNNDKVSFVYHCPDSEEKKKIIDYCKRNKVKNVTFFGTYDKKEIYDMYRVQSDWCNIIRQNTEVNKNALPNKFYDAMIAGVPVIVLRHNKAISTYVERYKLGLCFEDFDDLINNFLTKYQNFDYDAFAIGRYEFLKKVYVDFKEFEDIIKQIGEV